MKKSFNLFMVSGWGAGLLPGAPGTWGSAVVLAWFGILVALGVTGWVLAMVLVAAALLNAIFTLIFGPAVIAQRGEDPGVIVSDEQCGQALTYLGPWLFAAQGGQWALVALGGFLLFRFFDIVKPRPVSDLEKLPGAWGVLLDDIMAGIYAALVLNIAWLVVLGRLWTGGTST